MPLCVLTIAKRFLKILAIDPQKEFTYNQCLLLSRFQMNNNITIFLILQLLKRQKIAGSIFTHSQIEVGLVKIILKKNIPTVTLEIYLHICMI